MKKISIYILIAVFALGFGIPNIFGIFYSQNIIAPKTNASEVVLPQALVTVVPFSASVQTVLPPSASAVSSNECRTSAGSSNNFVQDSGLVNLNQPANCFSLKVSGFAQTSVQLAVKALQTAPATIVVQKTSEAALLPFFEQAPVSSSAPVLPLATFILLVIYEMYSNRQSFKEKFYKIISVKNNLGLSKLQIMRC